MMLGNFNRRVTIQEAVETHDGGGGVAREWRNITNSPHVYAAVSGLSAAETLRFHQLASDVSHSIVMRYRNDLVTGMRIIVGDATYSIKNLHDADGSEKYLRILAIREKL